MIRPFIVFILSIAAPSAFAATFHSIHIRVQPEHETILIEDDISLPENRRNRRSIDFVLNDAFIVDNVNVLPIENSGTEIISKNIDIERTPVKIYRARLKTDDGKVKIRYRLRISPQSAQYFLKSKQFSLLDKTAWYPRIDQNELEYKLKIDVPSNWVALSLGTETVVNLPNNRKRFDISSTVPIRAINTIGGQFFVAEQVENSIRYRVYLDENNAVREQQLLQDIHKYVGEQTAINGPYPYTQFFLVENSFAEEFSVPGFSSMPHSQPELESEFKRQLAHTIVQSWWPVNSDVVHESDDWVKSMIHYLVEHLWAEQSGVGADFRYQLLSLLSARKVNINQKSIFTCDVREDAIPRLIRYMMLIHLLRVQLGDDAFKELLNHASRSHRTNSMTWSSFTNFIARRDNDKLATLLEQWTDSRPLPKLDLPLVSSARKRHGYQLSLQIKQTQESEPYSLPISTQIQLSNEDLVRSESFSLDKSTQRIDIDLPTIPESVAIDPLFDLLRQIDESETPPTIGQILSRANIKIDTAPRLKNERSYHNAIYEFFARTNQSNNDKTDSMRDKKMQSATWLVGYDPSSADIFTPQLEANNIRVKRNSIEIDDKIFAISDYSFFFVIPDHSLEGQMNAWIVSKDFEAFSQLLNLIENHKDISYIAIENKTMSIATSGVWRRYDSKLTKFLTPFATFHSDNPRKPLVQSLP